MTNDYDKKIFAKNLRKYMELRDCTANDICSLLNVSKTSVSNWLTATKIPRMDKIERLANYFGVKKSSLIEDSDSITAFDLVPFPVIGKISAGYDGQAIEEETGEIVYIIRDEIGREEDYFVLEVKGNSMYPQFLDGDRVLIHRCESVDSGSIAAILYNGDEATLKKVFYEAGGDWMELVPINPEYQPKRIEKEDLAQCRVLGEVVQLIRKFK